MTFSPVSRGTEGDERAPDVEHDEALVPGRESAERRGASADDAVVDALRGTLARTERLEQVPP